MLSSLPVYNYGSSYAGLQVVHDSRNELLKKPWKDDK